MTPSGISPGKVRPAGLHQSLASISFPLLGEIILLFALPIWLNVSVHDRILDIVNILLDLKRIQFKVRAYQ